MNPTGRSLRVGIADDLRSDRNLLSGMLESLGHEVVFQAQSGAELLEACGRHQTDLVVADNLMPDVSGLEAAARIYKRSSIPVILLSAYSDAASVQAAERMHVAVYLVKPLEESNLEKAIALALRRTGQPEQETTLSMRNDRPSGFGIERAQHAEPALSRHRPVPH